MIKTSNTMQQKIVLLIGLICVLSAQEAQSGGFFSSLLGPASNVDFDSFDRWLTKGLRKNEDAQANLEYVRNNLNQLTDVRASRSAQIFVSFLGAPECNDDILMYARDMRRNNVDLEGSKRYQRLMKSSLERVFKLCSEHIGSKLEDEYEMKLAKTNLAAFLEVAVLKPHKWNTPIGSNLRPEPSENFMSYTLDPRNFELGPELLHFRDYLTDLAEDDPHSQVYHVYWDKEQADWQMDFNEANFDHIYNKYIIEPCNSLLGLADTFKGMYAMSELQPSPYLAGARKLTSHNRGLVLPLLYGYKACLNLDSRGPRGRTVISEAIELGLNPSIPQRYEAVPTA